jgi:serine/threonine protein kinase/WD40 repeat protein
MTNSPRYRVPVPRDADSDVTTAPELGVASTVVKPSAGNDTNRDSKDVISGLEPTMAPPSGRDSPIGTTPPPSLESTVPGHVAAGHAAAGHAATGHAVTGHAVTGHAAAGHAATGHAVTGHAVTGHAAAGHAATGHAVTGHAATGHAATGHAATGHAATGQPSARAPAGSLDSTIAPPFRDADRPAGDAARKPSLATVGATIAASAHDLPDLPIVDGALYTMKGEIGRGGMGRVIAARDRRLRRDVVIKVLHRNAAVSRFQREALITARLQHPSIVRVYDAGFLDGQQPFYAMECVRGESLDRVVGNAEDARARLALLPHVIAVAKAIAYAHSVGIIHRDLKPHNVLVGEFGETVVIDWGLAKDLSANESDSLDPRTPHAAHAALAAGADDQTVAGAVMGTPAFMPPEQARGEPADERADVYAIGAMLYSVLSGSPPVSGERALEDASAGAITPLREREPDVPPELASIVERAMAYEPRDRYATAKDLADELQRYSTGQLVSSHTYSAATLLKRWIRRHKTVLSVAAIATVLLVVLGVFYVRGLIEKQETAHAHMTEIAEQMHRVKMRSDELRIEHAESLIVSNPSLALGLLAGLTQAESFALPRVQKIANDAAANGVGFELAGPRDDVEQLVIGKNATAFTGSDDGHLWGWSITSRRGDDMGTHTGPIEAIAIAPNGLTLVTGSTDATIRVWDLVTGQSKVLSGHTGSVGGLAFAPDSHSFVSTSKDNTMRLWPIGGDEGKIVVQDKHPLRPLAWAPDGSRVWTGTDDGRVVELDLKTMKQTTTKVHSDETRVIALSPDGTTLATGGEDGAVFLLTLADRKVRRLATHADVVRDLFWTRDGTRIVSAGGDSNVNVTALDGKQVVLSGNAAGVKDLAISPDGDLVAAAGIDGIAHVWSLSSPKTWTLRGHRASVKAVEFTADGTSLISTSDDDRVRIWQLAKPTEAPVGTELPRWIRAYTNVTSH